MTTTHKITAEVPVRYTAPWMPADEFEIFHPVLEITFTATGGDLPLPEPGPDLDLVSVKVINADGVGFFGNEQEEWKQRADDWLQGDGSDRAADVVAADRRLVEAYVLAMERADRAPRKVRMDDPDYLDGDYSSARFPFNDRWDVEQ